MYQLYTSQDKAKKWVTIPGILRQLTLACTLTYIFGIIAGVITLFPRITNSTQSALSIIFFGVSFLYLAWCVNKVGNLYPIQKLNDAVLPQSKPLFKTCSISTLAAMLLTQGSLLALIALLLIPVNLGLLPFSPDGQFGVLLVIMAIQVMALGSTPLGEFNRSPLVLIIGVVFATIGIFTCISPGVITTFLQTALGSLNILGGGLLLCKQWYSSRITSVPPSSHSPFIKKLNRTQRIIFSLTILFGLSMLAPHMLPWIITSLLLISTGGFIFFLTFLIEQGQS